MADMEANTFFFCFVYSVGCSVAILRGKLIFHFLMGSQAVLLFHPLGHIQRDSRRPETAEVSTSVSCGGPAALSLPRSSGRSLLAHCCG